MQFIVALCFKAMSWHSQPRRAITKATHWHLKSRMQVIVGNAGLVGLTMPDWHVTKYLSQRPIGLLTNTPS